MNVHRVQDPKTASTGREVPGVEAACSIAAARAYNMAFAKMTTATRDIPTAARLRVAGLKPCATPTASTALSDRPTLSRHP
jgi:hypothetical protein